MTEQFKVLLSGEDIEAIRSALGFKADSYENFAHGSAAAHEVRIAHFEEAQEARNLSVFLANIAPVRG